MWKLPRLDSYPRARWAAWLAVLCLICACSVDASTSLDGREFLLESSEGFNAVEGTNVHLSFDDGELRFHAGCNGHSGSYTVRDGRLVVQNLSSTEIGCGEALHAQDEWLADFVTSSPALELDGDQLTLSNDDATLVFRDREVADPDRPLAATPWAVDTLIDGDAASNLPLASDPTLRFGEDGKVEIDTTCNTGSGRYTVSGDRLTLEGIAYTDAACTGASASADAHIQSVMTDGTLSFKIEATRLTVERGKLGLSAMAQ